MKKKAQLGILGFIGGILLTIAIWFLFLAEHLSIWGEDLIVRHSLTGVEAFIAANLNMFFWIACILGIIGYTYFYSE